MQQKHPVSLWFGLGYLPGFLAVSHSAIWSFDNTASVKCVCVGGGGGGGGGLCLFCHNVHVPN